jgi:hypothetical protein
VFTDVKRQLKAREEGGWARIAWALEERPELNQMEVVHGRLLAIDPKASTLLWSGVRVGRGKKGRS